MRDVHPGECKALTQSVWARLVWRLLAAVGVLWVGSVSAQSAPVQTEDPLPRTTEHQVEALLSQKAQRTAAQRKLSSHLLDMMGSPQSQASKEAEHRQAEPVTVDIRADVTPAVLERIRALGGTVINSIPKYRAIRARLPLAALEPLATLDAVQSIRHADQAQTHGTRPTD